MQATASNYKPRDVCEKNSALKEIFEQLQKGIFSQGDKTLFAPLVDNLLDSDPYRVLADYPAYIDCQDRVDATYLDQAAWTRMSILNTARMGKFSSDRAILQYCQEVWQTEPHPITDHELLR